MRDDMKLILIESKINALQEAKKAIDDLIAFYESLAPTEEGTKT